MSVTLTGTGGWGTRFGHLAYAVNHGDTVRGPETEALVSAIYADFQSNEQIAVTNLYTNRDSFRSSAYASWLASIQQIVHTNTIEQVNRDDPLPNKSLQVALSQLIDQLDAGDNFISRPTVTAVVTADAGNDGDAVLVASTVDPKDGGALDYALSENLNVVVTQDAAGGATAYRETCVVNGDPVRDPLAYNWPGGSGTTGFSLQATDGESTTLVTDGAFELWTGNVPNEWTTLVGAATITKGTAAPLRGSANLRITSDGSTLTRLRSEALDLDPQTCYALGLWAKIDAAAAGTLVVKLVDANGDTISDEASTANSLSINTNTDLGTSYGCETAFFRTPRVLPDTVYLDIHVTVAPTTGRVIDIDALALVAATQVYTGGPFLALFSGATKLARNDKFTVAVTNSHTTSNMSRSLDRLFGLRGLGLKFPSTTGFAILHDGLIAQG